MRNQLLGNRYRILDRIGEGGMAYVYLARDEKLGRSVAVKVLHEHMERNPDIRKRFLGEAQAISTLEHPNIVRIFDFSGDQSERLWIVTEIIRGKNLAQYVQQFTGGWLHPIVSACIVREVARALACAHSQGIVHRDIKPENVMITVEGTVKLMDFGIAKDLGKTSMTLTGTFMGSPSYMSPEQIRGRDVDLRSDLYSLSVLFYEIVTGRLPFTGQTTHDVVMKIMEGTFTHPRYVVPTLPDRLNDLIVRGMAKSPAQRVQNAAEYGTEIDRLLAETGFDESQVELARFCRDRGAYEERLAKSQAALLRSSTIAMRLRHTSPGGDRTAARTRAPAGSHDPTAHLPPPEAQRTSPFKVDDTWQKHLRRPTVPPAGDAAGRPAATRTGHPSAADPYVQPAPPRAATRHPGMADSTGMRAAAAAALPPREARARAPVAARIAARRSVRRSRYQHQSGWLTYAVGAAMVAMVTLSSLWGFWELQKRLKPGAGVASKASGQTSGAVAAIKPPRPAATKRDGTPYTVKAVTRKPVEPAATVKTAVLPKKRPDQPPPLKPGTRAGKRPLTVREGRTLAPSPAADPNLVVENGEIRAVPGPKAGGDNPPPEAPVATPVLPAAVATTTATATGTAEQSGADTATGKARILISSRPAAEIFLDGRRLGTTVDNTSDSGWLTTTSGRHQLELRRQGYQAFKTRLSLSDGEVKQLTGIELTPAGAATPSTVRAALTVRVNAPPAQVTIRNLDANTTQSFVLGTPTRVVPLDSGRYRVRIEKDGESRERELQLGGSQSGQLTFSVEFKGRDKEKDKEKEKDKTGAGDD